MIGDYQTGVTGRQHFWILKDPLSRDFDER
jgi:hypothetical protein